MWERFSFYTMVSMFTLYLRDPNEGFAWTAAQASTLYANYMMFVYCSPLIGGWIADKKLGYRRAVMIGGFFFMAGGLFLLVGSLSFFFLGLSRPGVWEAVFQTKMLPRGREPYTACEAIHEPT